MYLIGERKCGCKYLNRERNRIEYYNWSEKKMIEFINWREKVSIK